MASLGTAFVVIKPKLDQLPAGLNKAKKQVSAATDRMQKTVNTLSFGHVGLAATAFSATFVAAMAKSIDAASDLEEVASKFGVVFGDQVSIAEKWSDALVDGYAMSTREAKQYLSSVQDLLVPMGMQSAAAGTLSNEIVKLSADLGSFNNMPTAQVMDDIQSALVGNYETMKKYGVVLNAANVEQQAFNMGLATSKADLTAGEKAQAAYALMVKGSSAAIGDMARTSGSYANQSKKLHSNIEDLSVMLGNELLPAATGVVTQMNDWIKANKGLLQQDITKYVDAMATGLERIWSITSYDPDILKYGLVGFVIGGKKGAAVIGGLAHMVNWAQNLAGAFENAKNGLVDFSEIATANFKELEALAQRSSIFTGKIGPGTEGWGSVYKQGDIPEPITITPGAGSDTPGGGGLFSGGDEAARSEYLLNLYTEQSNAEIELEKEKQAQLLEIKQAGLTAEDEARIEALNRYIDISNAQVAAEMEYENTILALKKKSAKSQQTIAVQLGTALMSALGAGNEAIFVAQKSFEIGLAIMSAHAAAAKALAEVPYPYNLAVSGQMLTQGYWHAAAIGAVGIAQLAAGSGGGGGSVGGGTYTSPVITSDSSTGVSLDAYDSDEKRGVLEININGDVIGDESFVDMLVDRINDASDRDVFVNHRP